MDFRLLGPVTVEAEGRDLTPRRPRERGVLGILLLRHPAAVPADDLIDAVWGERPPATARTALQGLISALRRRLGVDRIETVGGAYRLRLMPGDTADVDRFEALVADASDAPPAARAELLRDALAQFRGDPLADLDLAIDLHAEIGHLEGRRLVTQEAQLAAELDLGRHADAIPRLERLVAEYPLREGLRSLLMLALYRAGRQADALRVAQDTRTTLATELGIDPGPALQRLERQVLDQDPSLELTEAPERAGHASLRDGLVTFMAIAPASRQAPGMPDPDALQVMLSTWAQGSVDASSGGARVLAFPRARDAAAAAAGVQRAARRAGLVVRLGLHSGMASEGSAALHAVRLAQVAHPGQVVLSAASRDLIREAPAQELDVIDLGEHRLADLGPRRRLFQLVAAGLPASFPPTRGLDDLSTNLPSQATALIDRASELAAISALLRDPATRLLTLTGPGGAGKTRLALHAAAAELIDGHLDAGWFVPLDPITDPALVLPSIAAVLGVGGDGPSAIRSVRRELQGRRTLLVLDNFEHLLAAAAPIGVLLEGAPDLTVLATSRVPLKLGSERVFDLGPLPVPAPARTDDVDTQAAVVAALEVPSVALFADRAAGARSGWVLTPEDIPAVAALCRALDGLPLAIELAASSVALMSPAEALERLDRPLRMLGARAAPGSERHRALDATIEWSYDLLERSTQQLFAGLAIFGGGWTLDAAEAVAGPDVDVVGGLAELADHSLVRVGGTDADPRFGMLETIRDFASHKLDASGRRDAAERRHLDFFIALAEAAEPELRGSPGAWLKRLEAEHDNLRAALDRLARRGDREVSVGAGSADFAAIEARLAGSLWRFWYLAGHLEEGHARLERALAAHRAPSAIRLKALIGAAVMAMNVGDRALTAGHAAEALALAGSLGDDWSRAYARFMLGNATDDPGEARRSFDVSLRAFRELGDEHSELLVARRLAGALEDLGRRDEARALHQDNLRRARAASNGRLEASTLGALAMIAFDEGRIADAALLLRESLRLHREIGDRLDTALDVARAARALAIGEQPEDAARLLGCVAEIRDALGPRGHTVGLIVDETRARLARQLSEATIGSLLREGASMRLDAAVELALAAMA